MTQENFKEAIALLTQAIGLEDRLSYNEPSDMIFPTRPLLGTALLAAGKAADAEAVFREDLKLHPNNGWAYYGLSQALSAQKKDAQAATASEQFAKAWSKADIKLQSAAY
jgi:tetratricopeptide (TPR) repeat protein